jgi:cell division protease FtsH
MDMMAEALMQFETIDAGQIDEIMEGRKPSPPADWTDGPSDSPSGPEASSPDDESVGDPITH